MITPDQRTEMADYVRQILGPSQADLWWRTPNPMLGGVKPYQMILMNRERQLYNFITSARDENDFTRSAPTTSEKS